MGNLRTEWCYNSHFVLFNYMGVDYKTRRFFRPSGDIAVITPENEITLKRTNKGCIQ